MSGVEFSLPDDLGWECNDEISKYLDNWMLMVGNMLDPMKPVDREFWQVSKAELMDNVYSIIKRYQDEKN